jgi:phospholipid/cholesterol/gamma-HCH transport system substrate-binding protein
VKRAILVHRRDFAAIAGLAVLAVAVAAYILGHQPAFTFGQSYYTVNAPFSSAAAVTSGQGQAVTIAGVRVGQIGGVSLDHGRAIVKMNIFKHYQPIYRNATVLLRPRTPLKDMYLSLDPGTPSAGAVPDGGQLASGSTSPDINLDQILSSLDADTRSYLLLLLSGGAQAFQDPGTTGSLPSPAAIGAFQGVLKRFAPLNRDTVAFSRLLSTRSRNIRRAIHNFGLVASSLGSVNQQLASLIRASNTNFSAFASQDANLQSALSLLPGTLQVTTQTLGKVQGFATASGQALGRLAPFAQALGPGLVAAQPLLRQTTPVIKNQLKPFSQAVTPLAQILEPASASLAKATPELVSSVGVINALFNTLAFQPSSGAQGYLFWGSWLSHIAASLTAQQDAQGPIVRGLFVASCPTLQLLEVTLQRSSPALGPLLALLNAPDWSKINSPFCPTGVL